MYVPDLRGKKDAASGPEKRCSTPEEGQAVATTIKAAYAETSALTQDGLKICFERVVSETDVAFLYKGAHDLPWFK